MAPDSAAKEPSRTTALLRLSVTVTGQRKDTPAARLALAAPTPGRPTALVVAVVAAVVGLEALAATAATAATDRTRPETTARTAQVLEQTPELVAVVAAVVGPDRPADPRA